MKVIRLDSEERRRAIIEAALPLFARKGFAGTTTKEIAEQAHVSEALVFKHFPSKQALYQAIMLSGSDGDPAFERLDALPASTEGLVTLIHMMVMHFLCPDMESTRDPCIRIRLKMNSFLEDGEFVRLAAEWVTHRIYPKFAACFEAAVQSGDLVASPASPTNLFWFSEHVATMLATVHLPTQRAIPYEGPAEAIVEHAVWFILRGIGLKDAAIRTRFRLGQTCVQSKSLSQPH
jgi:AcrR family transcriptional regulator